MADLTDIQAAQSVKIIGSGSTGVEAIPVASTAAGGLHTNLRDSSGTEAGTATNPVRVDTTGTTVQPISAATLPLPTGASTAANQSTEITSLQLIDNPIGPVAPGTAGTNSFLIGGVFNTSLPTVTNTQQAALQVDASGRLLISSNGVALGVPDKTTFTYGTTVEQVIGGVFQDTAPTLSTGTQGALRLNGNRALHSTLRDPTTDIGITSSSNGNAGNQLLHVETPDTTTTSTALGVLNATVSIAMAGLPSVGLQLTAGTLIGTIVPECSLDGGTTWVTCSFYDNSNSTITNSVIFGSSNTLKVLSILPIGGASNVRVRVSAYTSGTANSILRASQVTGAVGAVTAAAFGNVSNTFPTLTANTATLILASNSNRKYAYIANSTGTSCNIQFSSGTGLTNTTGLQIPAKSFYELKGDNLYTGNIYAFASSAISLSVTEGTP